MMDRSLNASEPLTALNMYHCSGLVRTLDIRSRGHWCWSG